MNTIFKEEVYKQKVQKYLVIGSILLMAGKFIAYYLTNSVGILTDAMESIVNVFAGFIGLYSLHISTKPKDSNHPFGHGKVELISASIEGLLIIFAGITIISEGIKRFVNPGIVEKLDIGIIIIILAGIINFFMGTYSIYIGKKYNYIALIAGGKHLQSDTYSTIGLTVGLIILWFTKIEWIDSILALIFGGIIVITGILILKKTITNLLDTADSKELNTLADILEKHRQNDWIDIHNLKMIKYGNLFYIDCDLTLPWYYSIRQGHKACSELEKIISNNYSSKVLLSVHSDSCDEKYCSYCNIPICPHRKAKFIFHQQFSLKDITKSDEDKNEKY